MGLFSGNLYSTCLRQTTHVNVIVPDESEDFWPIVEGEPRVLYLLHGLGANCDEWVRFSKIETYAKLYDLWVVMPEVQRSFYTDTAFGPAYLSYVAEELPRMMGGFFRMPTDRAHTFIAGESMGGYGAAKVAFTHPDAFAGVGMLSAVCDLSILEGAESLLSWEGAMLPEVQAYYGAAGPVHDELVRMAAAVDPSVRPKLVQCCGDRDRLAPQNRAFSQSLDDMGWEHAYFERSGDHDFLFWDGAIEEVIRVFVGV